MGGRSFVSYAAVVFAGAAGLAAQSNTGTLYGTVVDPQGHAVVGGTVTVRSADLASQRTVMSDGRGRFGVSSLVPGAYVVEARFAALTLRRPIRVTVALGTSTQLAVQLAVASVRQSATVTARAGTSEGNTVAPPINETESAISSFLAGTVVTYLPNRDRDVTQFDQLGTNVHEDAQGTGISVAGQRASALMTQVDGVEFDSPLLGGVRGAADRSFLLPQTVVREFQIVSSGVGAEVGMTGAGLINLATKEGSNKPHGEAFYTLRPAQFSSADGFGHRLDNFQSTYGGSFGGPIRKDRSFYYLGFEQDFLRLPTYFALEPQAPGSVLPGEGEGEIVEHNTPLAVSARVDEVLSPSNTLNLELIGNRLRVVNAGDGLSRTIRSLSQASSVSGQSWFSKTGLTTVLGPRTVNQAMLGWSSDHRNRTPNSMAPEIFINGFGVLGGDALGAHLFTSEEYQVRDGLSVMRGKSLFELGGYFDVAPAYEQREANVNGRFDYSSLASYQANLPRRFQQTFVMGNTRYRGNLHEMGLFVNAHVELRAGLTLTAGLRWAGQWNPQPTHANAAIAQTTRVPGDLRQWQPRLGVAWSPWAKTVVRGSAGLYTAPVAATLFHRVFADNGTQTVVADSYFDPQLLGLSGGLAGSPHALVGVPVGLSTPAALVVGIDAKFRNATSGQAALSVDQILSPKLTLRGGYLHASTWGLERRVDENLGAATVDAAGVPVFASARPLAGVGRLLVEQSSAHSSYDGLSFAAISQISRRTQMTVNYTLARTYDDDSNLGPYGIDSAVNPFALRSERAYSALDQRHTLNVSAIFNLPLGFKLNPLVLVHSGLPYTAIVGFDTQNDANDFNDRAVLNGRATSRNASRQPAFSDADLRLVKDFTLKGEGHHLDLFMDVFNVVGAANRNFGAEQVSFYGTSGAPVFSAGQALFAPGASRVGGPREVQFTARLVAF